MKITFSILLGIIEICFFSCICDLYIIFIHHYISIYDSFIPSIKKERGTEDILFKLF